MRIRALARDREVRLAVACLAYVVLAWLIGPLVHIDHVRGTYGVSIGTDTRYCSAELNTDAHGGGIDFWCQAAG